jgi:leucyl-tRNA synthetase
MFPYPSGAGLHVGHPRGYIASDVFARMKRMQGFNVLHPMGFDSFGLPAEQYAIQTGKNPNIFTEQLIKTYKKQLESIGFSYDWSREVATHRPEYYEWTQWIFLQIYNSWYDSTKNKARPIDDLVKIFEKSGNEKVYAVCNNNSVSFSAKEWKSWSEIEQQKILMNYRLAYEGYSEVNWCPELGTVLANDEIVDSPTGPVSERGGYPVEKKSMRQWFMRITAYADRLIQDLEGLDWSSHIKEIQKNWIGKSEGSEIEFTVSTGDSLKVFTTRADTLFGVTYVVLAPEHELVQKLKLQIKNWNEVETYLSEVKVKSEEDRVSSKEKTGVEIKGIKAINPVNGEEVPVWIADYVLAGYGTGAVMAVPAHDERDFAFAKKYNLLIKEVILIEGNTHPDFKGDGIDYIVSHGAYIKNGTLENSGKFSGLTSEQARKEITKFVGGKLVTKFKIRDAIFARQRYWGEPIPLIHTKGGSITTVKEKNLPLELPNVKSYTPSGTGESPLATVKAWTTAGYETNTMPGWAGSSWYFLALYGSKE